MQGHQILVIGLGICLLSSSVSAGTLLKNLKIGLKIADSTISIVKNAQDFLNSNESIEGSVVYRNETIYVAEVNKTVTLSNESKKLSEEYRRLAWEEAKDKKHKEAVSFYQKSLELDANNASAWHGYGWSLSELERFDEAKNAFFISLKLRQNADTWHRLGWNFERQSQMEDAKTCYIEALKLNKNHKQAAIGLHNLLAQK